MCVLLELKYRSAYTLLTSKGTDSVLNAVRLMHVHMYRLLDILSLLYYYQLLI